MRSAPRLLPVPALAAVVALVVGCAPGAGSGAEPEPPALTASRASVAPGAVLVDDLGDPRAVGRRDPVQIRTARVDGDTLRLAVEFGGGCEQHQFRLVVSRVFRESHPVQVSAVLAHDARGDACRALLRPELAVSLAPLADAYRAAYRTGTGRVVIALDGFAEPLRYTF